MTPLTPEAREAIRDWFLRHENDSHFCEDGPPLVWAEHFAALLAEVERLTVERDEARQQQREDHARAEIWQREAEELREALRRSRAAEEGPTS